MLVNDFEVACCRAQIVPVMDRVLSPYLRGGGAKSFNFQALSQVSWLTCLLHCAAGMHCVCWPAYLLSLPCPVLQDLLSTSMQIPFSVPPYMSLLARSVATLEGIALMGDPQYQMVAQVNC